MSQFAMVHLLMCSSPLSVLLPTGSPERCPQMVRIRGMLLTLLDIMELPPNPLDQLTDLMGGEEKVAEMTGRKGMLKREADGTVSYQRRCAEVGYCLILLMPF